MVSFETKKKSFFFGYKPPFKITFINGYSFMQILVISDFLLIFSFAIVSPDRPFTEC